MMKGSFLFEAENGYALDYLLLQESMEQSIDFVYIDPPFSTNSIFTIAPGKANSISRSTQGSRHAYSDTLTGEEYLLFLKKRLLLLKKLLSKRGSIFVHTDYKIGHYVKILMDEVFGIQNFQNDITRIKCNPKNFHRKAFGNIKDMILFYTKSKDNIWNDIRTPLSESDRENLFKMKTESGRKYTTVPLHAPGETKGKTGSLWRGLKPPKGRHWQSSPEELDKLDKKNLIEWSSRGVPRRKMFADEHKGKKIQDILSYKDLQNPSYPTEKNLQLLELLISNCSNKDSYILDSFCGSGTALQAAENLQRKWIGIDNSPEAIQVCKKRLNDADYQYKKL